MRNKIAAVVLALSAAGGAVAAVPAMAAAPAAVVASGHMHPAMTYNG